MYAPPQHPIHYIFGCVTHAPSVMEAWVNESFVFKMRYLFVYMVFFIGAGIYTPGMKPFDMAGIVMLTIFIMSLPAMMLDTSKESLSMQMSKAFSNGVLAFHGFFLTYFILYNVISLLLIANGLWVVSSANTLMALNIGLMTGFSLQLANVMNHKLPILLVPVFSIMMACIVKYVLG